MTESVAPGDTYNYQTFGLLFLLWCFSLTSSLQILNLFANEVLNFYWFPFFFLIGSPYTCSVLFKLGGSHEKGSEWGCRSLFQTVVILSNSRETALTRHCLNLLSPSKESLLWVLTLTFLWSHMIINPIIAFSAAIPEQSLNNPLGTQKLHKNKASFKQKFLAPLCCRNITGKKQ